MTTELLEIASLNDAAVFKWAIDNDLAATNSLLVQAVHRLNLYCRCLPMMQVPTDVCPIIAPLPVDLDNDSKTSYNKAFLLKASFLAGKPCGLSGVSIAAAVVFYNTALFYHHHSLHVESMDQYYATADRVLRDRLPYSDCLWSLQAAIWYNRADCARVHSVTPESCVYFGQLEGILNHLTDEEDRMFFQKAISIAWLQMKQCYCATVA